ncbi:hypothetical protein ETD83_24750 [Actinomadura soli]|uniref:Uncharacterized protein n=1 Tax=Actinomadura soli TaxID=2508997 RepID=A0A5C4J858_9ACTN|nr:hypothetical protein [Actinomadura soli]TMQ93972.1 hypothetical protein ETD83_24750 [Actinomadura soli]
MRRSTANLITGIIILLAACLTPGSASARQATWTVAPGGAFTGEGLLHMGNVDCSLRFDGTFFDSSGQGQIQNVTVRGCSGLGNLGWPSFKVPIPMTATRYLTSIDTVAAPLSGFIISFQGPCKITLAGPGGRTDPATMEALHQNQKAEMWWSSGFPGGLTVWDPADCYDPESVPIRGKFTITPAQTIRPSE